MKHQVEASLSGIVFVLMVVGTGCTQSLPHRWQEISTIRDAKTHMVPATWTLDKYPNAPTLKPHTKVTILDQDGPGVVTLFHVSDYGYGDDSKLILRIWYDHEDNPSIEMPLMDFLGDIESATEPYHTIHFSHVRRSHNFRLPMPFRRHIRVEVENPTASSLLGYMDIQWDRVEEIPGDSGYLKVAYKSGRFQFPHEELVLCDVKSPGAIVAHWLQLEGDHKSCANGQGICEANHEVYIDGDVKPTYESQGAEDFYGHSWGFGSVESDFYCAIVRYEPTPNGGTKVAMVRARDTDRITFGRSCKIIYTYKHDLGPAYDHTTGRGKAPALGPFTDGSSLDTPYRSCIYYYSDG